MGSEAIAEPGGAAVLKSTTGRQLSPRPIEKDDFQSWASREAQPLLKALKVFADSRYTTHFQTQTANTGVLTQVWQEDMPQSSAWAIDAYVTAWTSSSEHMRKTLSGLFFRVGSGVCQQEGAVATPVSITSAGGLTAALALSGNGVQLQINDDGNGNTSWDVVIVIQEAS